MAQGDKIEIRVRRQDGPGAPSRWETFLVPWEPLMNVISAFMAIQRHPVNAAGEATTAPVYSCNCLEEVCGACTMIINGRARQACSAMIDDLKKPIIVEPLTKYPVVRDLYVDRERIFEDFKRVKAWVTVDGTHDIGPGPRHPNALVDTRYELSRCMACGCCMESCPNYGPHSPWIGPAAVSQARLFNLHPSGEMESEARIAALLGKGGIGDCGQAQNCVIACPKKIPLTTSLADMMRASTGRGFWSLFRP